MQKRFTLLSLVLITISAMALSQEEKAKKDTNKKFADSIRAIEGLGGNVRIIEPDPGKRSVRIDLGRTEVTDRDLKHLEGFDQIDTLKLHGTKITGEGFRHIKEMKSLSWLELGGAVEFTDDGLSHLSDFTNLRMVSLNLTKITDKGIAFLTNSKRLEMLFLRDVNFTDEGLRHLEGMSELKELNVKGTKITDAGIQHLRKLTSLEEVDVSDTAVSQMAIKSLQEALPKTRIIR